MGDRDNALHYQPFLPEIDTFHVVVHKVEVSISDCSTCDTHLVLSATNGLSFQYDSFIREFWTSRSIVFIPKMAISALVPLVKGGSKSRERLDSFAEVMAIETQFSLSFFGNAKNREDLKMNQLKFVIDQDRETNRCSVLYEDQTILLQLLGRDDDQIKWCECLEETAPQFTPPFSLLYPDIALRSGVQDTMSERLRVVANQNLLNPNWISSVEKGPTYFSVLRKFRSNCVQDTAHDIESVLEDLYYQYFGRLDSEAARLSADFNVAVLVPRVNIRLVQEVSYPTDSKFDANVTILASAMDGRLEGIVFRYSSLEDDGQKLPHPTALQTNSVSLDVESILFDVTCVAGYHDMNIETIPTNHLHSFGSGYLSNVPVVGEFYISNVQLQSTSSIALLRDDLKATIMLEFRQCETVVSNQTIEFVFFSILSWVKVCNEVQEVITSQQCARNQLIRNIVYFLIDSAQKSNVSTEPLFLSSPSSVWSLGYRRDYQSDASWKILSHLWNCFRMIEGSRTKPSQLHIASLQPTLAEANQLISRWRAREHREMANSSVILDIFKPLTKGSEKANPKAPVILATTKASVNMQLLKATIFDRESKLNFIELEGSSIEFGSHPREQAPTNLIVRQPSRSRSKSKSEPRASIRQSLDFGRGQSPGAIERYAEVTAFVTIASITVSVDPNFLRFCREIILFAKRLSTSISEVVKSPSEAKNGQPISLALNSSIQIGGLSISAAAHSLYMTSQFRNLYGSIIYFSEDLRETPKVWSGINSYLQSKNRQIAISALIEADSLISNVVDIRRPHDSGDLLGLTVSSMSASLSAAREPIATAKSTNAAFLWSLAVFSSIGTLSVRLPTSLIKLHAFLENWGDVDSSISMLHFLFKELGYTEATEAHPSVAKDNPFSRIILHFLLNKFTIESDLLSAFSALYALERLAIVVDQSEYGGKSMQRRQPRKEVRTIFLGAIASHSLHLRPSQHYATPKDSILQVSTFDLPGVSCKGRVIHYSQAFADASDPLGRPNPAIDHLKANLRLGSGGLSVNVNVLDQLRTAQSLLGAEINDIIEIALFYSRQRQLSREPKSGDSLEATVTSDELKHKFFYNFKITMEGLRLSLESPLSYVELQSKFLEGFVMNYAKDLEFRHEFLVEKASPTSSGILWKFLVQGFSLSLLQSFRILEPNSSANDAERRQVPLAFVIMDFHLQNFKDDSFLEDIDGQGLESLFLLFEKVHAVMHPSAMGKMVDFFLFYKKELDKNSFRTAELNQIRGQIRENTQRLLTSVEIAVPSSKPAKSFFDQIRISIEISNFGTAIPLSDNDESIIGSLSSLHAQTAPPIITFEHTGHPAFIFSIRHVMFTSSRFEKSSAHLRDLCLQFVSVFDQTQESSFSPSAYPIQNRLLLENIHAQVNQQSIDGVSMLSIRASIQGFDLDVESNVAEYINSLSDIVHKGRERVISALPYDRYPKLASERTSQEQLNQTAVPLTFVGTFEFQAGRCKLNGTRGRSPGTTQNDSRPGTATSMAPTSPPRPIRISKLHSRQQSGTSSVDVDVPPDEFRDQVLYLPGITLWMEGKTLLGEAPNEQPGMFERKICIDVLVHPSDNTVHPSILIFFTEIMSKLRVRPLGPPPVMNPPPSSANISNASLAGHPAHAILPEAGLRSIPRSHEVIVFLRLSETKICLSCQPFSKVALTFAMEEADALMSFMPSSPSPSPSSLPEFEMANQKQIWSVCVGIRKTAGFLRHAFSPEDCFRGEIPGLALSLAFFGEPERRKYALEIDLPLIEGSLNVRYLQDFFLFRRLWLNLTYSSAPTANGSTPPTTSGTAHMFSPGAPSVPANPYVTMLRLPISSGLAHSSNIAVDAAETMLLGHYQAHPISSFLDTFHLIFRLGHVSVSTDLGQAIGKAMVHIDSLHLLADASWDEVDFFKKVARVRVNTIGIKSEGRISGNTALKSIQITAKFLRPPVSATGDKLGGSMSSVVGVGRTKVSGSQSLDSTSTTSGEHGSRKVKKTGKATLVRITIDRLESQIQYQYERILILEIFPAKIEARDDWYAYSNAAGGSSFGDSPTSPAKNSSSSQETLGIHVSVSLLVEQVKAILSRRTVPVFIQTGQKLLALIEEKRGTDMQQMMMVIGTSPVGSPQGMEYEAGDYMSAKTGAQHPRHSAGSMMPQQWVDASSGLTPSVSFQQQAVPSAIKRENETLSSLASIHTAPIHGSSSFNGHMQVAPGISPPKDTAEPTDEAAIKVFHHLVERISGRLRLRIGHAFVTFTRYNFRDPDCAQIVSKHVVITLDRESLPGVAAAGAGVRDGDIAAASRGKDSRELWIQLPLSQTKGEGNVSGLGSGIIAVGANSFLISAGAGDGISPLLTSLSGGASTTVTGSGANPISPIPAGIPMSSQGGSQQGQPPNPSTLPLPTLQSANALAWLPLENGDVSSSPFPMAAEMTVLDFGGISVRKCTAKAISQAEERMWSGTDWFTFMNSAIAKNVVGFPSTVMVLRTEVGRLGNSSVGSGSLLASQHLSSFELPSLKASSPPNLGVPAVSTNPSPFPESSHLLPTHPSSNIPSSLGPLVAVDPKTPLHVDYSFRSDFSGQIDIALNLGLYRYLEELRSLYVKAIETTTSKSTSAGGAGSGGTAQGADADDTDVGESSSSLVEGGATKGDAVGTIVTTSNAVVSPTSSGISSASPSNETNFPHGAGTTTTSSGSTTANPGTTDSVAASNPFIFSRKGELKFDPQLKVTGDANPWELVQWLGVNKERVPELVYTHVTVALHRVLTESQRWVLRIRVGEVGPLLVDLGRGVYGGALGVEPLNPEILLGIGSKTT
ncbi:hypothetical protein HDU97_010314 [Phlyctochytrium planicorne]|nr:hypothetical protein HDU97_010314 [Phlyctochytrium planicorne]